MSNLNRGHSIDDSYQVSVVAMFVNDRDEMSNLHRGHSIDASYQVSVHLAKQVGIHILIFFLVNLAKGNMSFCHHLVSIVCHPFTFHILSCNDSIYQPI
jgi:hypothetical protein